MKYKFTGKERDDETSYDYFGARYYDSRIGRWGQMEPKFENYIKYSPYMYALNNPMILKDFWGLEVDFSEYIKDDKNYSKNLAKLIADLSAKTGLKLSIVDNKLVYDEADYKAKLKSKTFTGSEKARDYIKGVIEKGQHYVLYSETGNWGSFEGENPNTIGIDPNQIESFIKGTKGMDNTTQGWAFSFIHELLHNTLKVDDPKTFGQIGDVEKTVNEMREELDMYTRQSYKSMSFKEEGPRYIPFGLGNKNDLMSGKSPQGGPYVEY